MLGRGNAFIGKRIDLKNFRINTLGGSEKNLANTAGPLDRFQCVQIYLDRFGENVSIVITSADEPQSSNRTSQLPNAIEIMAPEMSMKVRSVAKIQDVEFIGDGFSANGMMTGDADDIMTFVT